jgi:hypothetical protein
MHRLAPHLPHSHRDPRRPSGVSHARFGRTSLFSHRGAAGVTLAAGVLLAAARPAGDGSLATVSASSGLAYDIHLTVTTIPAHDANWTPTPTYMQALAHAQVAAGKTRIDVTKGPFAGGILGDGDFLTVRDNAVLVFKPQTKQYASMDLAKLAQGVSGLSSILGGTLDVRTTGVKVDVTALGAGDKLQQYSTLKYRLTEDYKVTMSAEGKSASLTTHSTTDYLFAPALTGVVNPLSTGAGQGAESSLLGSDYAAQMTTARGKLHSGVPVRTVTTTNMVGDDGDRSSITTTWELSNISPAEVPDAVFDVPAGYTRGSAGRFMMAGLVPLSTGSTGAASTPTPAGTAAAKPTPAWNGNANSEGQAAGATAADSSNDSTIKVVKKLLHLP